MWEGANRVWRRIASLSLKLLVRSILASVLLALIAWIALYELNRAIPLAPLDPVKLYDGVLEAKRDWPKFERQLTERDREQNRELLAFFQHADTGAVVVIVFGFYLGILIVVLLVYLIILVFILSLMYLFDQWEARAPA